MKTSFNFEGYRKNLAEELKKEIKEKGFDDARQKLSSEQDTIKYDISQELKKLGIKNAKESYSDQPSFYDKLKGIEDKELAEKFQEVDISQEIPEWTKILIDIIRLKAIKNEKYSVQSAITEFLNKYPEEIKNSFYKDIEESGGVTNVFNNISKGKYLDKRYLNHVVDALDNEYYPSKGLGHLKTIAKSTIAGEHFSPARRISNHRLDFAVGYNTHFNGDPTKKMIILSPEGMLADIMGSKNNSNRRSYDKVLKSRFKSENDLNIFIEGLKKLDEDGEEIYEVDRKDTAVLWELMKRHLPIQEKDSQYTGNKTRLGYGFSLPIEYSDDDYKKHCARWADIADTIIDLEAGKAWYRKNNN